MDSTDGGLYDWDHVQGEVPSHAYLAPAALDLVRKSSPARLLDLGCGDGRLTAILAQHVSTAVGFDFSVSGIQRAELEHSGPSFFAHSMDDELAEGHRGCYDFAVGIEVIEHLLLPRSIFRRASEALSPDGKLLLTTPYHGYWKNLALALTNRWDHHHTVDWDYGHIKFFSPATLESMASSEGFRLVKLERVGRIPPLAASMVALFERSGTS